MNKKTSKWLVWSLPVASLALLASFTYGRTRIDDGSKKSDNPKVLKKATFAHESDIDTYLTSVRSYMLTPPRDGRFGAGRVPTLHGKTSHQIPGYEEVNKLLDNQYAFGSFVAGVMPESYLEGYRQAVKNGQMKESDIPTHRVTMVHGSIPHHAAQQQSVRTFQNFHTVMYNKAIAVEDLCRKEGYDVYSDSMKVDGKDAWFMAKSVHASDKSCYSCHVDIKQGEPIGYVIAFLMKEQP